MQDPLEAVKTVKSRWYGPYCAISGTEPSSVTLISIHLAFTNSLGIPPGPKLSNENISALFSLSNPFLIIFGDMNFRGGSFVKFLVF